jgi:hypothetical protein
MVVQLTTPNAELIDLQKTSAAVMLKSKSPQIVPQVFPLKYSALPYRVSFDMYL